MHTIPDTGIFQPGQAVAVLPATGFVRLPTVLVFIPVCKTVWWEGVKSGLYPKPVKVSKRCTAWKAEDIHALIKRLAEQTHEQNLPH